MVVNIAGPFMLTPADMLVRGDDARRRDSRDDATVMRDSRETDVIFCEHAMKRRRKRASSTMQIT